MEIVGDCRLWPKRPQVFENPALKCSIATNQTLGIVAALIAISKNNNGIYIAL
jgi:hypothetical protein